jgi:hypothetical protein
VSGQGLSAVERSLLVECLLDWLGEGFSSDRGKVDAVKRLIVEFGGEVPLRDFERFQGRP